MSSDSWPPKLKDFVARCLNQMTDFNRSEAQAELKELISTAYSSQTMWTTDWDVMQLKSLMPKPLGTFANSHNLKRKSTEASISNKKAKKSPQKNHTFSAPPTTNYSAPFDPNDQAALHRRAARFQREHEIEKTKHLKNNIPSQVRNKFQQMHISRGSTPNSNSDDPEANPNVIDWDRHTIVGTSKAIFKDYLRLTSEPKPEDIRPFEVLKVTLTELKNRWRQKSSYNWICSQFKSLRQDLTVQRIKNDFTVSVYEIHARIALETGDMVEYNQCQATLKTLYELGIPGNVEEFTAYRILMLLHGRNHSDLNLYVGQLTPKQKANPAVSHALRVQRAISMGNYFSLFELYNTAPNMGAYIMDHFVDRERVKALMVIAKAYKSISLQYICNTLGFDDLDATRVFLSDHGAALFTNSSDPDNKKMFDCKPALPKLTQAHEEKYRKVLIKGAI